jgi:hypothetical protein
LGLVLLLLAAQVDQCQAILIATDHFLGGAPGDPLLGEYDTTTNRNQFRRGDANGGGQDPTIDGFTGPWSGNVTSGTLGVAQWTAQIDPLGSALPYQQGGRARFGGVDNLQRRVQRELSPYTAVDTYYFSVASQVLTGDTDLDGFAGIGFTNTGSTVSATDANLVGGSALRGFLIGVAGDGVAGTDYVIRHVGSSGVVQNDVLLDDIVQNNEVGSPFLRRTIVKLEFNDEPANPSGNSKITVWQDPTNVTSEAAASASVTPLEFRTFALSSNADLTHLTFTGIDYSRAASFDEPRLATTWEDASPLTPGDYNGDGFVNAADYTVWRDGLGTEFVEGDYDTWAANYGGTLVSAAAAIAVPEPSALAAVALGAALLGGVARRDAAA